MNLEPKEEASLADMFIASTHGRYITKDIERVMMEYRVALRRAHRFVFTDEFVEMATEASLVPPEKTLSRIQYATLPYDTTWFEFNLHVKMAVLERLTGGQFDAAAVPPRQGMLLQRINDTSAVCTLFSDKPATAEKPDRPSPHMASYFFSTVEVEHFPKTFGCVPLSRRWRVGTTSAAEDIAILSDAIEATKSTMWGYTGKDRPDWIENNFHFVVPKLLDRHGEAGFSRLFPALRDAIVAKKQPGLDPTGLNGAMRYELAEFAGSVRWLVTVLAMMNEVPISTEAVTPTGYQRAGRLGKNRLLDYHKVSLVLPKTNPVRWLHKRLSHEEIRRRRAHEVRAHWRTYLHENHCGYEQHDWVYDHENGYRLCGKCDAYGRLIHEHIRGNVELGWVKKDYVVKAAT